MCGAGCDKKADAGEELKEQVRGREWGRHMITGLNTSRYKANVTAAAPVAGYGTKAAVPSSARLAVVESEFAEDVPAREGCVDEYQSQIGQCTLQGSERGGIRGSAVAIAERAAAVGGTVRDEIKGGRR